MKICGCLIVVCLANVLGDLSKYDIFVIPLSKLSSSQGISNIFKNAKKTNSEIEQYDAQAPLNYYLHKVKAKDYGIETPKENFDNDKGFIEKESEEECEYITRAGKCIHSLPRQRDDDYVNLNDDKIVGGFEVEVNLYPYHAAYGSNCGGAIIHRKWIITAGHCGNKPYVRVGSKYLNEGRKVRVKNHYVHPLWSTRNKDHPFDFDFQLLELAQPLKLDNSVQPIKVARIEDMVIGKVVTVTGWGNTKEHGPYSNVLRAVRVPIISKDNCQSVSFPYFRGTLTPQMFCAGFKEGYKDACQGDSGGPAAADDRLLGLVSFGYGCATPGAYGVYSKIAKVRSWIEETTALTLD